MKLKLTLEIIAILVISSLFVFGSFLYVPFDMDEFCHYHALSGYLYPLNMLNTFGQPYKNLYLTPFLNFSLLLRSYAYQGIVPCIIYYPLFKLWPAPYSARILGLIMLVVQVFLIRRLFEIDVLIVFVALFSYMAYAFQHIVDTSSVVFQTTNVFFICYLAKQWMVSLQKNAVYCWCYPFVIGIILFLGIEAKLTYFVILPSNIALIFYWIIINKKMFASYSKLKILLQHLIILFSTMTILSLILLNSKQPDGTKYHVLVTNFKFIDTLDLKQWLANVKLIAGYFLNPLKTAHRLFIVKSEITAEGILLCSIIIALLYSGIKLLRARGEKCGFIILNILLFFITLFLMSRSPKVLAMHHVVLSLPFLIFALSNIFSKLYRNKIIIFLAVMFLMVNLRLYYNITRLENQDYDHPSKIKVNNLLNEQFAKQYVFVVIDWGMYYIKALYGNKNQCVLYIEPLNKIQQIIEVKKILEKTKRKALFIGRVDSLSNLRLIKDEFPDLLQLQTDFDTGKWRIWYEK